MLAATKRNSLESRETVSRNWKGASVGHLKSGELT